jgi:hypothetical protein
MEKLPEESQQNDVGNLRQLIVVKPELDVECNQGNEVHPKFGPNPMLVFPVYRHVG